MNNETFIKEPTSKVVIRFQDCDPFGHLNNARYIDYFINAREDHLAQYYDLDIYKRQKQLNENWAVIKHQISYIAPVFFREKVIIKTCLLHFTANSVLMEGAMLDTDVNRLKSVIWTKFVYFNLSKGKSIKHSDELMQLFESIVKDNNKIKIDAFDSRVKEIKNQFH